LPYSIRIYTMWHLINSSKYERFKFLILHNWWGKTYHDIFINLTHVREVLWNLNSIQWWKILCIKDIQKIMLNA
jgi:hypothetical protein